MALVGRRYRADVTLPTRRTQSSRMPRRVGGEEIEIGDLAGPDHRKLNKLARPVLPTFGNRIVGEAELEQVVVRHHPMNADDPRQLRLVGIDDVLRPLRQHCCWIHLAHLE